MKEDSIEKIVFETDEECLTAFQRFGISSVPVLVINDKIVIHGTANICTLISALKST